MRKYRAANIVSHNLFIKKSV